MRPQKSNPYLLLLFGAQSNEIESDLVRIYLEKLVDHFCCVLSIFFSNFNKKNILVSLSNKAYSWEKKTCKNVSSVVGPWLIGELFPPSISYKSPSFLMKAMKCKSTSSSASGVLFWEEKKKLNEKICHLFLFYSIFILQFDPRWPTPDEPLSFHCPLSNSRLSPLDSCSWLQPRIERTIFHLLTFFISF